MLIALLFAYKDAAAGSPDLVGALGPWVAAAASIVVAFVTGRFMLRGKSTPEAVAVEKMWKRLDQQDARVTALREGIIAFSNWAARVDLLWPANTPKPLFTEEEQAAIKRARTSDARTVTE